MKIIFLGAYAPLVKQFNADGTKEAYPLVKNFTSYEEEVDTCADLYMAITRHAKLGHCMLKGHIQRPLVDEPRAGATLTNDRTQWICLDFDRHETPDIDAELNKLGLGDVSYILQYSASHGLDENMGTVSAHVFMLLDGELAAPALKAWLMDRNLTVFRDALRLSRTGNTISWPLDITTCQNDKLLYIAPPRFVPPQEDPFGKEPRIAFVVRKNPMLPVSRIGEKNMNVLKQDERKVLNELRKGKGLPARTARTSFVGSIEVQNKPDVCEVTGIREDREFIRLNLNGGDSWAYWHHKDNFELVNDYKSDTWYRTKELAPTYYAELLQARAALNATPTESGDLILAFRDFKSAEYYNGLWNPSTQQLELYRARNETQLDHWMRSHGRVMGDYIPVWYMNYLPRQDFVVDEDAHTINTFRPSSYMLMDPCSTLTESDFPTITGIIRHMLAVEKEDPEGLFEHWLNWFACIFQRKHKPLTAWVCHGVEGTGKGYVVNKIISPLLNHQNVSSVLVNNIEDGFNGWMESKLFAFVDEVDVDDFKEKGRITAKLRNYITEPTMAVRHMRQAMFNVPNNVSFMFSSNRPQPVSIPQSDRRYNVGNFQGRKLPRPNDAQVESELAAFAQFLLTHKACVEQANTVIQTEARERIQKLSQTSLAETCQMIKEGDFEALWLSRPDEWLLEQNSVVNSHTQNAAQYVMLLKHIARNGFNGRISRDELQVILQYNVGNIPTTPNKFTSLLRHNGIETTQMRRGDQKFYGIEVTWKLTPEFRAELEETLSVPRKRLKSVTQLNKAA